MLASIATFAEGLGAAFLLSELGAAELIVGLLVTAGLIGCAARGIDREHVEHQDAGRHRHA